MALDAADVAAIQVDADRDLVVQRVAHLVHVADARRYQVDVTGVQPLLKSFSDESTRAIVAASNP